MIDNDLLALGNVLVQTLGHRTIPASGYEENNFSADQLNTIINAISTAAERNTRLADFVSFLFNSRNSDASVSYVLLWQYPADESQAGKFVQFRTTLLFDLFNRGALRGSDALARQALLDAFSVLPNQFLTSDGCIIVPDDYSSPLLRQVDTVKKATLPSSLAAIGAIDKFPSLMNTRGKLLADNGNRIIPGAMIRDGVYVGHRNIFMFHAAVNIAAYIGDDNLIDSHASVGSAAQIGNKNKLGSFVSLEGVLSPANAQGVIIGNDNFLGSFVRVGTGITIGNYNMLASGINLSLGTKLRDCRENSPSRGEYITCRELNESFNQLVIAPNNARREFQGLFIEPGEYILFENSPQFMSRFEGDTRIKAGIA